MRLLHTEYIRHHTEENYFFLFDPFETRAGYSLPEEMPQRLGRPIDMSSFMLRLLRARIMYVKLRAHKSALQSVRLIPHNFTPFFICFYRPFFIRLFSPPFFHHLSGLYFYYIFLILIFLLSSLPLLRSRRETSEDSGESLSDAPGAQD